MNLNFANVYVKTLLSQLAGFAAVYVDAKLGQPTGGLATYLGAHADVAAVYVAAAQLVHNYISKRFPPAP